MNNKILFTGYYGFKNYGDDLFGIACVNGLKISGSDFVPAILSPPVSGTYAKYLVPKMLGSLYTRQGFIGNILRALFMIYGCFRYSHVVLSGGSVVSSGSSFRIRYIQYCLAKLGLCRLSAIGISVGPFSSEKDRVKAKLFINSLSYLTVRDKSSVKECNSMGVDIEAHLYNDLAGCAPLPVINTVKAKNIILGVSICKYESIVAGDEKKERLRNLSIFDGISNFAIKYDAKVKILILNSNEIMGDVGISEKLCDYLSGNGVTTEIVEYVNPVETLKEISICDILFSVRLHGAISAYLLDVPFLLVEYHDKCKNFLDYIGFDKESRISASIADKMYVSKCLETIFQGGGNCSVKPLDYIKNSNNIFTESPWVK